MSIEGHLFHNGGQKDFGLWEIFCCSIASDHGEKLNVRMSDISKLTIADSWYITIFQKYSDQSPTQTSTIWLVKHLLVRVCPLKRGNKWKEQTVSKATLSVCICLHGRFTDLERQADTPWSYLFVLNVYTRVWGVSFSWLDIYLFYADDFFFFFWKARRAGRGVLRINRVEETEGAREWDSHKLQIQLISHPPSSPSPSHAIDLSLCERPWEAVTRDLQWRVII